MNTDQLLTHYKRIADAPDAIPRLRQFILDLAVRGKLVPQDPNDEPASELLKRIKAEKARLVKAGDLKRNKAKPSRMADAPFELPQSWKWTAVGGLFLYDAGTKRKPESLNQELWLLELEDVEKDTGQLLARVKTSERESKSTKSEFSVGDILYGKLRPYLNKVIVADEPGYSTTEIVALRPYLPICSQYCALALRRPDFVVYVTRLGQGTKMPRLRTEDAVIAPFPLPPLAEQHRIVAKVDELMALCDRLEVAQAERETTRTRLTAVSLARLNAPDLDQATFREYAAFALDNIVPLTTRPEQIKALRQTILDLAVRGKLVPQDPNDEPASELLKRIKAEKARLVKDGEIRKPKAIPMLTEEELPFTLPANWRWVKFGNIADFSAGRTPTRNELSFWNTGDYPWLSIADMNDGETLMATRETVSEKAAKQIFRSAPKQIGTMIMSFKLTIGKIARLGIPAYHNEAIISIHPYVSEFDPYLFKVLPFFARQGDTKGAIKGATLNRESISNIPIPLPPLAEQHRIVAKVDELMALCDRLEASLITGDDTRHRLLNALLHEALEPGGCEPP